MNLKVNGIEPNGNLPWIYIFLVCFWNGHLWARDCTSDHPTSCETANESSRQIRSTAVDLSSFHEGLTLEWKLIHAISHVQFRTYITGNRIKFYSGLVDSSKFNHLPLFSVQQFLREKRGNLIFWLLSAQDCLTSPLAMNNMQPEKKKARQLVVPSTYPMFTLAEKCQVPWTLFLLHNLIWWRPPFCCKNFWKCSISIFDHF